jgi:Tol biopolymer transport system component
LPDGRHFLYLSHIWAWSKDDGIYVGSLDSKESRRLVDSHWMPAYAPAADGRNGYLLYAHEGNLLAQQFDSKTFQLTGQPVLVADGIEPNTDADTFFSVSANGTLAYRPVGVAKTQLSWFDRAGKQLGTVGMPVRDIHPALSRDGKRLAVVRRADPQAGNSRASDFEPSALDDIWVWDLERGTASRLTFNFAADWPVWSPDGLRIFFASNREGNLNLYQKASSGAGTEELLLKSGEDKYPCDWSSDGRFLLYASLNPKTFFDIWVLPLDRDRKPFPFLRTPFGEGETRLSPDGQWVAYHSNETGRWEVYIQPFLPDSSRPPDKWQISTEFGSFPTWRGDGKELFYVGPSGKMMAAEVKAVSRGGRLTLKAGVPKLLFDGRIYTAHPYTATADGQRFLLSTQVGEERSPSITVILNWTADLKP